MGQVAQEIIARNLSSGLLSSGTVAYPAPDSSQPVMGTLYKVAQKTIDEVLRKKMRGSADSTKNTKLYFLCVITFVVINLPSLSP